MMPGQGPWGTSSSGQSGTTDPSGTGATGQTEFQKLQDDLQAIQDKSQVTPALEAAVRKDFETIQTAATSAPDPAKLKTLADDQKALAGELPTDAQRQQIKDDFAAVLKSQGIADQTLIDQTIADLEAVDRARNITADDLATLAADRKAIDAAIGNNTSTNQAAPNAPGPDGLPFGGGPFGSLYGI